MTKSDSIINQISFSQDDRFIAGACFDEIQKKYHIDIFDVETGELLLMNTTELNSIRSVSWHPKTNILAYGGEKNKQGIISLLPFNKY
mmetsp:Transcript_7762/g.8781  ORF Transcript_7762/g.8781 Transcript_7762/m.8781 type:complete len:88 (+) Transcript_7762:34-297(+)